MRNLKEIRWGHPQMINNERIFESNNRDARDILPGEFGSQYPRMLIRENGQVLIVYTVYRNAGYLVDSYGGNTLVVARSFNGGESWEEIACIKDPGRDLDNGQLLELPDGRLLLACRSVIWQQSYILPVYCSKDDGLHWEKISVIDENSGEPAQLGNPDRGVYEPHLLLLDDDSIGVMYASEKYACDQCCFSQVISQKISRDKGHTWGEEVIVVCDHDDSKSRPGMPVWDRLPNGKFILVYEIIATYGGDMFYKISKDGKSWESGIGSHIPFQKGGAYILPITDKILLTTSNTHHVSISNDGGVHWCKNEESPWETLWLEAVDNGATCTIKNGNVWPAIYRLSDEQIIYVTSVGRSDGGNNIQFRIGELIYEEVFE